ncbi:hypothetical protein ABZ345_36715 [Lentzea sp. NPDC005914]|uniref:hypothetical protein n=1 Tax=Lentzea sp. NPDC005914 TaxID=3154572 RepID=UPI0033CD0908
MTLAASALALYFRTRVHFRQLTTPVPPSVADHYHPHRPITLDFPVHTTHTPRRRRPRRPLTAAIRHLLRAYSLPPPSPLPPPIPAPPRGSVPPPSPVPPPPVLNPPCRLCAAATV